MKAYSYIRFSTPEQRKGDSLRRQLEDTREYCKQHKLDLDESLTFRDLGVSGHFMDNVIKGRLGDFIAAIECGKVQRGSCLIVENLDRISRAQIDDATEIFKKILRKGIDIITLTDGKRFTKDSLNNPMDLMLSIMYFYRAYDESYRKGKMIRKAWKQKRLNAPEKPLTAICPSWLKLNRRNQKFETVPEAKRIVRRIFDLSKNGMGNNSIAKYLNRESVPGIGRTNSWHASVVSRILKNRAVLGEFQPCTYIERKKRISEGEPIKGYFPPIVSEELFNVVQYRQTQRRVAGSGRRGDTLKNLFSHVAKCGWCGAAMIYTQKRSDSLVCDNARRGYKCDYVGYPYPEFEKSFFEYVQDINLETLLQTSASAVSLTETIDETRSTIDSLSAELNNVVNAIAARSSSDTLLRKLDALETRKQAQEEILKKLYAQQSGDSTPFKRLDDLKQLIIKARDTKGKNSTETRLKIREKIRSCVETVKVYPYERIDPDVKMMSRKERREFKADGWSLTSDIQRVMRGYWVQFRNGPESVVVYSHPKCNDLGATKITPIKKGKEFRIISSIRGTTM